MITFSITKGYKELAFVMKLASLRYKLKVFIFSPDVPEGSSDLTLFTPRYRNPCVHSLIFLERLQLIFCS